MNVETNIKQYRRLIDETNYDATLMETTYDLTDKILERLLKTYDEKNAKEFSNALNKEAGIINSIDTFRFTREQEDRFEYVSRVLSELRNKYGSIISVKITRMREQFPEHRGALTRQRVRDFE